MLILAWYDRDIDSVTTTIQSSQCFAHCCLGSGQSICSIDGKRSSPYDVPTLGLIYVAVINWRYGKGIIRWLLEEVVRNGGEGSCDYLNTT